MLESRRERLLQRLFRQVKVAEQANQRRQDATRLGAIDFVEDHLLDLLGDCLGDLALQGEDVAQFPLIGLGPEVLIGVGADQLGGDPSGGAGKKYGTFDDHVRSQLAHDVP